MPRPQHGDAATTGGEAPSRAAARTAHAVADQGAIARLLAEPATYGEDVRQVERLDTHASMVFLAGDRAYKVKRAVAFPYMDFGTPAKRRAACEREIALNRRTAPELYLGLCPIVREGGALRLGPLAEPGAAAPAGEAVEWAVVMRRFPQDRLLDRMAEAGELDAALVDALAAEIAAFHEATEAVEGRGAESLEWVIDENAQEFPENPELFPPEEAAALSAASRRALEGVRGLLDDRARNGLVRRCHGDLHLRNLVLIDDRPRLFDAIEFNDAIACIDVLYDLAFLLMDLDRRGLAWAGNRLLERYLQARDDLEGLAALPLFLSLRAAIRAKVEASALAAQPGPEAGRRLRAQIADYFAAARAYLDPPAPRLVAVGGVSGTGKTTLARRLAPGIGATPGALVVRSDVERKRLLGAAEHERLPEPAYRTEVSARVYERMLARARRGLAAGRAVILDATFLASDERRAAAALAGERGVAFAGLWLRGTPESLKRRVAARGADASDATEQVVEAQIRHHGEAAIEWPAVDADGPPEVVLQRALARLETSH